MCLLECADCGNPKTSAGVAEGLEKAREFPSRGHWTGAMGNTCACIRPSKEVLSSPSAMAAATGSGEGSRVAEQIQRSQRHWSERVEGGGSLDEEAADNRAVFRALQLHPTWGGFFQTFGYASVFLSSGSLEVGEKFAEGAQAELFHARVTWRSEKMKEQDLNEGHEWVLKVFKMGTSLRCLLSQWPLGFLKYQAEVIEHTKLNLPQPILYICDIQCGTLLKDGRFAFLMQRQHEDLRSLIECNMLSNGEDYGPFSKDMAESIMYKIAKGMNWLHNRNIVHRDLKASNVLFREDMKCWGCFVADFECSIGVVGTGFFRAPEIVQAFKNKVASKRPEVFSKEADVYSYEILTGKLPFEGHPGHDYDFVLKKKQRPHVPGYVDDWVRELLSWCWQEDPTARPSFGEIMNLILVNSPEAREYHLRVQQFEENLKEEEFKRSLLLGGSSRDLYKRTCKLHSM